jgi:hypothetical protein
VSFEAECAEFYRRAMELLQASNIPFLLGGAYALGLYTGIERHTKDADFFLREKDLDRALAVFQREGYRAEKTFPHWLAKVYSGDSFIDLIYAAGNGLCGVDEVWFARARPDSLLGIPVKVTAPEEMIWMKAFIQERERYDGADVAHLILSCAESIDWQHLQNRFGEDWRLLYSQLVLFGYIFPSERERIPAEIIRELNARMEQEQRTPFVDRICRGTLLSRAQYLADVKERGYRDARLEPRTAMAKQDVVRWTAAIGRDEGKDTRSSGGEQR